MTRCLLVSSSLVSVSYLNVTEAVAGIIVDICMTYVKRSMLNVAPLFGIGTGNHGWWEKI